MITLPNDAEALPQEYLDYIASIQEDVQFSNACLFREPKDPGMALGRRGDENFFYSVLIGFYKEPQAWHEIILKYDSPGSGKPKAWEYAIAEGAEWKLLLKFDTLSKLIEYLRKDPRRQRPPSKIVAKQKRKKKSPGVG